MPTTIAADEQIVAPPDTAQAVIAAAQALAEIWKDVPGGWRRLRPEAVHLIEAVHANNRAEAVQS